MINVEQIKQRLMEWIKVSEALPTDRFSNIEIRALLKDSLAVIEQQEQRIEELERQIASALHDHLHAINPLVTKLEKERDDAVATLQENLTTAPQPKEAQDSK